jgi:signal transduction histidine kinase
MVTDYIDALRPMFDCLSDGVCVTDSGGQLLYANEAACRLLGPAMEETAKNGICGSLCSVLEGHCAEAAASCALKTPRGAQDAAPIKGRYSPTGLELRVRCMRVRRPSVELHFVIIEDVSTQAEAGRAKEEWRQMLAHDFRSPLTVALGTLRAVEDMGAGHTLAPGDLALVEGGVRNCRRLESLIGAYLDTTRLEDGAMPVHAGAVDLEPLIQSVVDELTPAARERGQNLTFAASGTRAARADAELLRRALTNIVGNALKFTPPGGRIMVEELSRGRDVLIRVIDNGPGITAQDLPRVFDRYYQGSHGRRDPGLGLGLTFCRAALRAMEGEVEIESEEGKGSVFTLRLPQASVVEGAS